jgi:hypothetical protein
MTKEVYSSENVLAMKAPALPLRRFIFIIKREYWLGEYAPEGLHPALGYG